MKTRKLAVEVLEGRALPSGLWDPGPGGGTPVPTGPLGVPILAGKGNTGDINFETPGGAVQVGNEVVFLDQDHWERGGFEDLEDIPGAILVDLVPDDEPEPSPPDGGGGGGGILGWLGNLFGGGKNKDQESSGGEGGMLLTPSENSLAVPPDVDVPGPNPGGGQQTVVRPPSQPETVGDIFHNPYQGISLTPGGKSETFVAKSSDVSIPPMWQADWQPEYNVFSAQSGQATGSKPTTPLGLFFETEMLALDVVAPRQLENRNRIMEEEGLYYVVVAPRQLDTRIPDGGTVLLGAPNGKGLFADGSVRGITLVEVLTAARTNTVDNNEVITIHG